MKDYKMKAYGTVWLFLVVVALLTAGCGTQQSAPSPERQQLKAQSASDGQVADHLENLARGVHGVKNANCVVFNHYAIVGIDVDEKMERSEVGTLKYAVAEAFRKDPYGINAVVTADIDLAQRIREIRADMNNGRPIAGFAEELADIVGRLIPQIPRNIIPPQSPEDVGNR